jgi:hypothetical protein
VRFVKIDRLYINLDRVTTMYLSPAYCSIRFTDDPDDDRGRVILEGDQAARFIGAINDHIGDGVYVA